MADAYTVTNKHITELNSLIRNYYNSFIRDENKEIFGEMADIGNDAARSATIPGNTEENSYSIALFQNFIHSVVNHNISSDVANGYGTGTNNGLLKIKGQVGNFAAADLPNLKFVFVCINIINVFVDILEAYKYFIDNDAGFKDKLKVINKIVLVPSTHRTKAHIDNISTSVASQPNIGYYISSEPSKLFLAINSLTSTTRNTIFEIPAASTDVLLQEKTLAADGLFTGTTLNANVYVNQLADNSNGSFRINAAQFNIESATTTNLTLDNMQKNALKSLLLFLAKVKVDNARNQVNALYFYYKYLHLYTTLVFSTMNVVLNDSKENTQYFMKIIQYTPYSTNAASGQTASGVRSTALTAAAALATKATKAAAAAAAAKEARDYNVIAKTNASNAKAATGTNAVTDAKKFLKEAVVATNNAIDKANEARTHATTTDVPSFTKFVPNKYEIATTNTEIDGFTTIDGNLTIKANEIIGNAYNAAEAANEAATLASSATGTAAITTTTAARTASDLTETSESITNKIYKSDDAIYKSITQNTLATMTYTINSLGSNAGKDAAITIYDNAILYVSSELSRLINKLLLQTNQIPVVFDKYRTLISADLNLKISFSRESVLKIKYDDASILAANKNYLQNISRNLNEKLEFIEAFSVNYDSKYYSITDIDAKYIYIEAIFPNKSSKIVNEFKPNSWVDATHNDETSEYNTTIKITVNGLLQFKDSYTSGMNNLIHINNNIKQNISKINSQKSMFQYEQNRDTHLRNQTYAYSIIIGLIAFAILLLQIIKVEQNTREMAGMVFGGIIVVFFIVYYVINAAYIEEFKIKENFYIATKSSDLTSASDTDKKEFLQSQIDGINTRFIEYFQKLLTNIPLVESLDFYKHLNSIIRSEKNDKTNIKDILEYKKSSGYSSIDVLRYENNSKQIFLSTLLVSALIFIILYNVSLYISSEYNNLIIFAGFIFAVIIFAYYLIFVSKTARNRTNNKYWGPQFNKNM
jgi:hypothetical protein